MSYANKFRANMEHQRAGAARESKTFRVSQSSVPDNPLSSVATAMLLSARDKLTESSDVLSYLIQQHMSLRLDVLRLAIFPRSMNDHEMAQFIGQDVHARLDRRVGSDSVLASRDLHLSFSSMSIAKFTHLNHSGFAKGGYSRSSLGLGTAASRVWVTELLRGAHEAIIVGLPSMTMEMSSSEENIEAQTRDLRYNFVSRFIRRQDLQDMEDIFITLNMSLYTWLTSLRKNLAREMEQMQAVASKKDTLDRVIIPEPSKADLGMASPPTSPLNTANSPSGDVPHMVLTGPPDDVVAFPASTEPSSELRPSTSASIDQWKPIHYIADARHIERLNMRQLGGATPDVMHPFFMKVRRSVTIIDYANFMSCRTCSILKSRYHNMCMNTQHCLLSKL